MYGNRLKELRKERGYTQNELSKQLNISQITYSQYEREVREPSIEMLKKIANFYKTSVDYIIDTFNN